MLQEHRLHDTTSFAVFVRLDHPYAPGPSSEGRGGTAVGVSRCVLGACLAHGGPGSLEVVIPHPPAIDTAIRYTDLYGTNQEIPLDVPLPGTTAGAAVGQTAAVPARGFHLPRRGRSPMA